MSFDNPNKPGPPSGLWRDSTTALRDLRRLITEQRTWVFVADSYDNAVRLHALGVSLRDVPGLQYGTIDFCNLPTGHTALLTVLAVPKAYLDLARFNALVAQHQLGCRADSDTADIVVLCSQAASRETVVAFVLSITKDACFPGEPSGLN
jgi:hypothetical protein